jgi:transcriptional regulator with XRE-family HTH domain
MGYWGKVIKGRSWMSDDDKSLWELLEFSDQDSRARMMAGVIAVTLSWQLKALRKNRDWSQADMADKAGLSFATIVRVEDPEKVLHASVGTLLKIAAACDVALIVQFADWKKWMELMLSQAAFVPPPFNADALQQNTKPPRS